MPTAKSLTIFISLALVSSLAVFSLSADDASAVCRIFDHHPITCTQQSDCSSTYVSSDTCYYDFCGCNAIINWDLSVEQKCAYDEKDANKPTCAPYADGNTCYYSGAASCEDTGWGSCSYANSQTLDLSIYCPGGGATCTSDGWECPTGPVPECSIDAQCGTQSGTNRVGKCVEGKCEYGRCSINPCDPGYCCEDDISVDANLNGQLGDCAEVGKRTPDNVYLCVSKSPAQWSVCDENNIGNTMEDDGISYVCVKEDGSYKWSEASESSNAWLLIVLGLLVIALK